MSNFDAYGKYYDLLYRDKDYEREADYVHLLIQQYKYGTRKILELGCGSGAHARWLTKHGYHITGIDRSKEMICTARSKKIVDFFPVEGDITSYSLNDKFQVVISLFHVISYITETTSLIKTFEVTARHLEPAGIFIFDVWYTPAVLTQRPQTRIKRLEDEEVQIFRLTETSMDVNQNKVDVNFEVIVREKLSNQIHLVKESHPMRHFSIPEIEILASHSGFELLAAEEFLTRQLPGEDTWGVCFILRRKNE